MLSEPITTAQTLGYGSTSIFGATLVYAEHLPLRFFKLPEGEKLPHVKWKDVATKDPEALQSIAVRNPRANIGGTPDGDCVVFDIDKKNGKDGFATVAKLEPQIGTLPETLTATTPNGGEHRFYRVSNGVPCKSLKDVCGYDGIDVRASEEVNSAGYVVMAPSRTADGEYRWKNWDDPSQPPVIADLPLAWLQLACGSDPLKPKEAKPDRARKASPDRDSDDAKRIEHLRAALKFLDFNEYDVWISCGEALKPLDDAGLELWLEWSAGYAKYNEAEALEKWETFKPSKTDYPAIFAKAQAAGWHNPGGFSCDASILNAITEFNQNHAVVLAGGSAVVLRESIGESGASEVCFIRPGDLKTLYQNRKVSVPKTLPDGQVVQKSVPLVAAWLEHPDRRTYGGITFAPANDAPVGYFNLWRGLAVEPFPLGVAKAAFRCKRLLHHMKYNVCSGNRHHFRYLLAWCADMIQNPGRKNGVSVVLRGKQGTGKSKLCDVLRALLGGHAFKASKSEHIIGRFSSHLADKLLIVAEESFFAGAKADIGALKDLITSNTFTSEAKGINAIEVRSCHRVIMNTNQAWAVPASDEERRYFVLDVGEAKMQDHDYFAALDAQIFDGGGLQAFLSLLMKLDISKINLRKVPQTKALEVQKRLSLEPHDSFILDCLQGGEIAGRVWPDSADPDSDPRRQEVYEAYVQYARSMQVRVLPDNRFGKAFADRTGATVWQPGGGDRRRKYQLPPLAEVLKRFNAQIGIRHDHDE